MNTLKQDIATDIARKVKESGLMNSGRTFELLSTFAIEVIKERFHKDPEGILKLLGLYRCPFGTPEDWEEHYTKEFQGIPFRTILLREDNEDIYKEEEI